MKFRLIFSVCHVLVGMCWYEDLRLEHARSGLDYMKAAWPACWPATHSSDEETAKINFTRATEMWLRGKHKSTTKSVNYLAAAMGFRVFSCRTGARVNDLAQSGGILCEYYFDGQFSWELLLPERKRLWFMKPSWVFILGIQVFGKKQHCVIVYNFSLKFQNRMFWNLVNGLRFLVAW